MTPITPMSMLQVELTRITLWYCFGMAVPAVLRDDAIATRIRALRLYSTDAEIAPVIQDMLRSLVDLELRHPDARVQFIKVRGIAIEALRIYRESLKTDEERDAESDADAEWYARTLDAEARWLDNS